MAEVVQTICRMCLVNCGVKAWVDNGKLIKVEGDPDNPMNLGALCAKGLAAIQLEYSDKRILHPLKRKGARGEGQWEHTALDEAFDIISDKLGKIKETYGAQSICYYRGAASGWDTNWEYVLRFMNVLGSPNVSTHGQLCFVPVLLGSVFTYGAKPLVPLHNMVRWTAIHSPTVVKKMLVWGDKVVYSHNKSTPPPPLPSPAGGPPSSGSGLLFLGQALHP